MTLYPSTCHGIDALIGGGFPTGVVSHIYGEPGSGKTSLCIQLATSVIRSEKRVIFIASDPFPSERFAQIAATDTATLSQKLLVFEVKSFDQQRVTLRNIKKIARENVGLIIFDAVTTYYRLEQAKDTEIRSRHAFANQVLLLLGLAKKYDLAVTLTNQVYVDTDTQQVLPVAGYLLDNVSAIVLQFVKTHSERRRAILKKHSIMPLETSAYFKITGQGLSDA
ncbi:MAG: DNA repair and recombination protein RadB [Halobacteriota archaeon]